jgi:hypothetical protein
VAHVVDKMLHCCGGTGFKKEPLQLERYLRDGKAGWVMGPTNEVLRQFVGKTALLGMESLDYWNQVINRRALENEFKKMTADQKRELAEQLLAEAGYLPVDWTPDGDDAALTPQAQARAAVDPPAGSFSWRYPNSPHELTDLWKPGQANQIMRGAVMMFQDTHHLQVDSFAGPAVWRALLADVMAHKRRDSGYSYVYVHRSVPQKLTLWHNGHTVLTSPGNTGVPAAPTDLGTFPVFEHIPVGTMSGNNPDGSHYNDPGIKWISYFNGGEALHAFNRASFGTPQSLGCVELPLASAQKVWPYTPIGTLVTIED